MVPTTSIQHGTCLVEAMQTSITNRVMEVKVLADNDWEVNGSQPCCPFSVAKVPREVSCGVPIPTGYLLEKIFSPRSFA
jgi:hypothetical protein